MAGQDEDDEMGFEAPPHPDDRLWRHPAEVAAELARQQAGEADDTIELRPLVTAPAVRPQQGATPGSRNQLLAVAAAAAFVGLGALTLGVLSGTRSDTPVADTTTVVADSAGSSTAVTGAAPAAAPASEASSGNFARNVYDESNTGLAQVQAAHDGTMHDGSAVVVTPDGHLVTSTPLVAGADYVVVWLDDGSRWPAHVIAADPVSSIAVLRIDRETSPVRLGSDQPLRSGQYALAAEAGAAEMSVGEVSSFHLRASGDGTTGSSRFVVSGLTVDPGTAIFDDSGALIGIAGDQDQSGVSMATPAWMIERVAIDLITSGTTTHAWFGAEVEPTSGRPGVTVTRVDPDSPAGVAGLNVGDRISAIDGRTVSDGALLWGHLATLRPGVSTSLDVERWGATRTIVVSLGER